MGASHSSAPEAFGPLLRRHRQALGLSQEDLAGQSGLSVRAVANMERGRTVRPHRQSVQLLADALGLSEPERRQLDAASHVIGSDLEAEPGPAPAGPAPAGTAWAGTGVPHELPAPVRHFTGRAAELAELSDMAAGAGGRALVICAVGGTAGVGKTALAVWWAHQVAERFPDGQLYVNLRGYDPGEPVPVTDVLAGFLRALGVPGPDVPDDLEERARLYRSRLAGRRVLVVLDNARDGEQVRPLLPGDPACVAVVTSRDALAGLVATDGARRLDLEVLPLADAVGLLGSLIGPRASADPEATAALAGLCARLPLALRIAAELAAARPSEPVAGLVAELAAARLDGLDAGEDRADVRAVFSWSLRQLPESVAGAFALMSLHPGAQVDVYSAAALTGTTAAQARRVLDRLARANLLQAAGPGRFSMHDLLCAYAREQAADGDTAGQGQEAQSRQSQSRQAQTRLFDYYLSATAAAMDRLYPAEAHLRPRVQAAAASGPAMAGETDARAWLDTERPNLVAVVAHCAGHGWPRHVAGLAGTLFRYLMAGSHLPEAATIYARAFQAAVQSGDVAAEAAALNGLGGIATMKGRFREAADHYQSALKCYRRCGDRAGQAKVLHNLGIAEQQLHDLEAAVGHYREAIAAFEDIGEFRGAARALAELAAAETDLGCYDQASAHLYRALPVFRDANDQLGEAAALGSLGDISLRRDQLLPATDFYEQALAIHRRIDHPTGVATELGNLGEVSLRQGKHRQAISYLRQALVLFREIGYEHGEIVTLSSLAKALHAAGRPDSARGALTAARQLAAETGNTYLQASAHRDLAESYHRSGQHDLARHYWQQALDLYTQLDATEAEEVRSRLRAGTEDTALTR